MGLSALEWIVFLLGCALAFGYAAWLYGRREERRPRAWILALLRGAAIAGALFLLFDPSLAAEGRTRRSAGATLLDGSRSLGLPEGDATLWSRAVAAARETGDDLWVFGGEAPRVVHPDSLPAAPELGTSRLAPAVRAAAQAGHRALRVVSDGEVVDAAEALDGADRYGVSLDWTLVRGSYPRASIAQVAAPAWAETGDTVEVRAFVVVRDVAAPRIELTVTDSAGRTRARAGAPVPDAGRFAELGLRFPVGPPQGVQRFEVALLDPLGDEERRDDRRSVYIDVSGPPASPILLSLQPSWEASFLLPNLSRAGDVGAAGYVRVRPDRWLTMGEGYRVVSPEQIRRRVAAAPLVVLVGYGPDAPAWVDEVVRSAPRVWIFPAGPARDVPGWDVRIGALEEGEWYADATLPPSPITGMLAGIDVELFPPLTGLRRVEGPSAWSPLLVRRARRGAARPAVVAGVSGGRRWAVAPGVAYWRWGFRPGGPRDLYRGLTTGVAGWLLQERAAARSAITPVRRAVHAAEPIRLLVPGAADSVHVVLHDSVGETAWEGRGAGSGDTIEADPLPVGRYRYDGRAWRAGRVVAAGAGPVEVEAFHPELVPSTVVESARATRPPGSDGLRETGPRVEGRRPLRRSGWPFLLLLGLLCAEWMLRHRHGLR